MLRCRGGRLGRGGRGDGGRLFLQEGDLGKEELERDLTGGADERKVSHIKNACVSSTGQARSHSWAKEVTKGREGLSPDEPNHLVSKRVRLVHHYHRERGRIA